LNRHFSESLPTVYVVDASIAITGAFVCARNQARMLVGEAHVVLVLPSQSAISEVELVDFHVVRRAQLGDLRKTLPALLRYLPQVVISSWQLCRWMKEDGASRLQFNDFYFTQLVFCRIFGFRGHVVTWVRTDPRRFGRLISRIGLRMVSLCSDNVNAVSKFIQSTLGPGTPSQLVYDCLVRASQPDPQAGCVGRQRLVYVANYIAGKGQDDALECFAAISSMYPDMTLEFWGGDMGLDKNRQYRDALVERCIALGLQQRVHFGDFLTDPRSALAGAYAAMNFSHSESFSMTVLEASAAGVPVIATRSGGPSEIIADGVTGILVPVRDRNAMVAAMRLLLDDEAKARAMGDKGREFVEQAFAPSEFRSKLLATLCLSDWARRNSDRAADAAQAVR
jgi:glycosyltransferase involved in cell wall biosynthesis